MLLNDLPPFVKNSTCAVTGHRRLIGEFDFDGLVERLEQIVNDGYEYFLIGMAVGFDSECFRALEILRGRYPSVKIVGVVPCADQSRNFSSDEKVEYERMLASADFLVKETRKYYKGCMLVRNDFLVDNASALLAYYSGTDKGGTRYTVNKAIKKGLTVKYFPVDGRIPSNL